MITTRFRISLSCLPRLGGGLAAVWCGLVIFAAGGLRAADFASLTDIVSGTGNSSPQCFVELGGKIYFTASNGTSRQLYRYDSAAAAGSQITQVSSFTGNTTHPSFVRVLGTRLVMAAHGSGNGYQLWEYDPAAAAGSQFTEMVTVSGVTSPDAPRKFLVDGGKLYFAATNGARPAGHGFQLYVYDPASPKAALSAGSPNPKRLTNLATNSVSGCNPANLIAAGGYVLFSANLSYQSNGGGGVDQVDNIELVAVNTSTLAVTTHDLAQGSLALTSNGSGYTDQFDSNPLAARAVVGNTAYFSAAYTASPHGSSNYRGQVLMKFDPTTMTTPVKVAELNPDSGVTVDSVFDGLITTGNFAAGDSITAMVAVGTKVYYAANSGSGAKLHLCDTASADAVSAIAGFDAPSNLATFNSRLYCLGNFSGTSNFVEVEPSGGAVTSFALATSPFSLGGYITVGSNMYFAGGADMYLFNASARTVTKQTGITSSSLTGTSARQLPLGIGTAGGDFLFAGTDASVGTEVFHFAAPATPAPTVTSLSAHSIAAAGGTSITITGTNFTGATAVKFGGTNATSFTVDSTTQITAVAPAGTGGATGNVTVTTSGGTSSTGSGNAFSYAVPLNGTPAYVVHDGATTAATRFAPVYGWAATTTTNAPVARDELTAVWTGATGTTSTTNRLIVWGGNDGVTQKNTGGLYNPATDTWTATTTAGAPTARLRHTAVWTGDTGSATTSYRMIVFGGEAPMTNTGGIYNPGTDSWSATTTTSAPTARAFHTAIWTGATGNSATANKMIVWGGYDVNGIELNSGGIYDPASNTWTATATAGAPTGRVFHTAIWTGDTGSAATSHKMIVFGGESPYGMDVVSNGGVYDPATNSWSAIASSATAVARAGHTAIWTGSEMIVFGGYNSSFAAIAGGARYNPATGTWGSLPSTNQPSARQNHTAIWSGDAMVIFGGHSFSTRLGTGVTYSPSTDTWTALTSTNVPAARTSHAAVWSGSQMILFGGSGASGSVNTGAVLSVAPTVSLGSQAAGTALSRSFTIESTGSGALTGVSVSFTGANASDFAVTSAPASTIAAGSNSAFTISFTPAAGGARSATLQIASNDPVRAPYLITLSGTGLVASPPTVDTTPAGSIATTSATLGGQVTADGGAAVTERGIVYSASTTTPTTSDSKVSVGSGTGAFSQSVTGLNASTTYYFRGYATNSSGTSYGTVLSFTTLPPAPVITNATLVATGTYGSGFIGYTITASNSPTGYSASGLPTGLSIDSGTGAISGTPAATGTFNVTLGAANAGGSGTATLVLTINKRTLLVSGITASGKIYDGTTAATINATNAVLTGKISGDDVTLDKTNAAGVFVNKAVGTRPVTLSGLSISGAQSAHYSLLPLNPSAVITAKPLTITGVVVSNKVYDGTAAASLVVSGAALAGVAAADSVTLVASSAAAIFAGSSAGTHAVAISGFALASGGDAANYTLTQPSATANITRATLTVTADAATRAYGAANPALTATLSGFVANEDVTSANITGNATLSTAAVATSPVGTHEIVASAGTLAAANYSFTTANGTLIITKAALTVTTDDKTRIYGAANPAFTATITGFVNGETVATSGITGTAALSTTADAASGVASYPITAGAGSLGSTNYTFTFVPGTLAVTPAVITVAAENKARSYATPNPELTATVSGFVNGDTAATVLTGTSALSTAATAASSAGAYPITVATGSLASANYTFAFVDGTLTITPASAQVTLSNGIQTYSGQPRSIGVSTSPGGLAWAVSYNGSATAPIAAGTYSVIATITDSNHTGGATGTLIIERGNQTITFAAAPSTPLVGLPFALSASASSGLPVTFAVVSGNATLTGASLTLNDANPVVMRATQAGSANLLAASAQQTFTAAAKRTQTIAFAPLENKRVDDPAFTLAASATSGLSVSFTVVSGPAMVSGNTVTLTGLSGAVIITAAQPGNGAYSAAPEVTQTFNVIGRAEHQVFFGLTTNNDTVAVDLAADGKSGTLLCYLGSTGEAFVVSFTVNADGTFDAIVSSLGASATISPASTDESTSHRSAAVATRTFRGRVAGGTVSGTILELGLNFNAVLQPASGPTAAIAGLYNSSVLNSANGTTASIVGTQGQVLAITSTAVVSTGGAGTVNASGAFEVEAPGGVITGVIDAPTTTVSGSVAVPKQAPVNFAGLANSSIRTGRLANLSSRARIGPAAGHTLITGFVVGGSEPKPVLLRAIGPALGRFGVTRAIANPRLELYNAQGQLVLANDDWSGTETAAAFAQVGAFALENETGDAALMTTLTPGAYTMHVRDAGETGVALAEIYDASENPNREYQRLVNISSRGMVEAGDAALIGGFVVTGNSPKKVLVRGVGPALAAFGVGATLTDPRLAIYSGQTLIAQNNDWSTPSPIGRMQVAATAGDVAAAGQATGAFTFTAGSKDSAIVITLAPGPYTAQVTSSDGTAGVALVEVYELPE